MSSHSNPTHPFFPIFRTIEITPTTSGSIFITSTPKVKGHSHDSFSRNLVSPVVKENAPERYKSNNTKVTDFNREAGNGENCSLNDQNHRLMHRKENIQISDGEIHKKKNRWVIWCNEI